MLSISLSKKTFGIKNKTLLNLAARLYMATSIIIMVSCACEIIYIPFFLGLNENPFEKFKKVQNPLSFVVTMAHFYSAMISTITGFYILPEDERLTKKQSIRLGCITIFHLIFCFNPWIANYQKDAEVLYVILQYTIGPYYILFCCCLAKAAFICWLPWQNQSMRKKPKYEVIYGGNDTKKISYDLKSV